MIDDFDLFGEKVNHAASILGIRFGVPPFSVLSARDGGWQDRKRQWIALGIQSELGRGGAVPFSETIHRLKPTADKAHQNAGGGKRLTTNTPHIGKGMADGLVRLRALQKAQRENG